MSMLRGALIHYAKSRSHKIVSEIDFKKILFHSDIN